MKANEIIAKIKAENPEALGKVNEKVAARIAGVVFGALRDQLAAADEGIKVQGLGSFRVSSAEREKDGKKVTVKKILFVPAKRADAEKLAERKTSKTSKVS